MRTHRSRTNRKRTQRTRDSRRRYRVKTAKARRGGALGRIPPSATVSIQQDPYSARMLVDTETAEDVFDARGAYLL